MAKNICSVLIQMLSFITLDTISGIPYYYFLNQTIKAFCFILGMVICFGNIMLKDRMLALT